MESPDIILNKEFQYFLLSVFCVSAAGGYITSKAIKDEFYENLLLPSWAPPPGVISTIWIILYFMIAFSTFKAYTAANDHQKNSLIWLMAVQLLLNFGWVYMFFGLKNPRASLSIIFLLLISIGLQGVYMYNIDKESGKLFLPYFIWVCFASYLNYTITKLNEM